MRYGWLRGVCLGSFVLLAIVVLAGCGGSSGGGDGGVVAVTYSISGQVTSTGSGLPGVTMTLSGASSKTAITDASGNYTITGLDNGSYTVTPSRTGFTFNPTSIPQTVSGVDIATVNFVATAVPVVTHSISGQVTSTGSGLSGVTMNLSGASSANTTTIASGDYTFTGLANGNYTVTPSKTGFTFSPTSLSQTVSGSDITGENFTATSTLSAQIVPCPASGTTPVSIFNFAFSPIGVTIGANGIVKWTNNDTVAHTVTSGTHRTPDGKFNSGNLGAGGTVCVQFNATGTYQYFCTIHPFMTGSVTVQ